MSRTTKAIAKELARENMTLVKLAKKESCGCIVAVTLDDDSERNRNIQYEWRKQGRVMIPSTAEKVQKEHLVKFCPHVFYKK